MATLALCLADDPIPADLPGVPGCPPWPAEALRVCRVVGVAISRGGVAWMVRRAWSRRSDRTGMVPVLGGGDSGSFLVMTGMSIGSDDTSLSIPLDVEEL